MHTEVDAHMATLPEHEIGRMEVAAETDARTRRHKNILFGSENVIQKSASEIHTAQTSAKVLHERNL
jgi:hypothetical protein